jgi:hypothetical protein
MSNAKKPECNNHWRKAELEKQKDRDTGYELQKQPNFV